MTGRVVQDLRNWRMNLLRFRREAERDGDYLIDWRPWARGERTHVAEVDAWIKRVKWLLKECKRRTVDKDEDFFEALWIAKAGERLSWLDRMEVNAPALEAYQRQRNAQRRANTAKALNERERATLTALCVEFWRKCDKPTERGAKARMLRWVAYRADIPERRVRSYLDRLPVPYLGDGS